MHGSYPKLARREDRQDGRLRRARGCLDGRGGLLHTVVRTHAREAPASEAGQAGQPNIILILTDDQEAASIAYMPRLQALLVQQGLTFAKAFVTYPLCCPSRASILTGQYPHNHQVLHNAPPLGGFQRFRDVGHERSTIATWLQASGYRTGLFGKYLNGYPADTPTHVPPGWSAWS